MHCSVGVGVFVFVCLAWYTGKSVKRELNEINELLKRSYNHMETAL